MTATNDIANPSTNDLSVANTQLAELSARANAAHQRVFKAAGEGLLAAFEAGQALLQARKVCLGRFMAWLPKNFNASLRTAERYMEFAEQCHSIGGMDSTRVSSLTPQEVGRIWSQIVGPRSGKKSRHLPAASTAPCAAAAVHDAAEATTDAPPPAPAIDRAAPPLDERCDVPVDLMPALVPLFAGLIEECRRVGAGDDCYDGEYADTLADRLEPHYTDLLDYMEYRMEWRSKPGYTGAS